MINRDRVGGFNCPVCGSIIPTSMEELFTRPALVCPMCSLELVIDRNHSQQALHAMEQVLKAEENLNQASKFKRE